MRRSIVEAFTEFRSQKHPVKVYKKSIVRKGNLASFLLRERLVLRLVVVCRSSKDIGQIGFAADETGSFEHNGVAFAYLICPCNHENALVLRKVFSFTRPRTIGLDPAVGMGDRTGLATPGHIRVAQTLGVLPVLAQQSIREMERTQRTPMEVLDDVSWAVFQEGYRGGYGADADHLKTAEDASRAFEAGFTMYTIDPSDHVVNSADTYGLRGLRQEFEKLPWNELECRSKDFLQFYLGRKLAVKVNGEDWDPKFTKETLLRAAVKYSAAIAHTAKLYRRLKALFGGRKFDIEMSVDETEAPTSLLEHYFIVSELRRLDVRITGLALRFVGRFEKAIDYVGDLELFERSFRGHVAIARSCGPYKLSIHSGSDKFSIYPIVGKLASDIYHLKTAGTSYLEALRIVARHDPSLFRAIVKCASGCFDKDRKSYQVSTNTSLVPNPDEVKDKVLEAAFLNENNGRQLLHIAYGSILTARTACGEWLFRDRIRHILTENEEEHYETVAEHIQRHVKGIQVPSNCG